MIKSRRRFKKKGLAPGSLVYVGEPRTEPVRLTVIQYDQSSVREYCLSSVSEIPDLSPKPEHVTWLNVDGLHDIPAIEAVGKAFGLHPLVLEDVLNTTKRPKFDDLGNYIFIVMKEVCPDADGKGFHFEQLSVVLGPNFVISFQERRGDFFDAIRKRLREGKGRLRKAGPDYLAYALLDSIVDSYFLMLEVLGEKIETLEDEVINRPTSKTLAGVHDAKREALQTRRAIWPLREMIGALIREETDLIERATTVYLRDVYDHVVELIDILEADRDLASGLIEIYLSSLSNRMNQVMVVLAMFASIFMPITFIAGVYGMNFKYMPELDSPYGYPGALALMAAVTLGIVIYFKRKRWL